MKKKEEKEVALQRVPDEFFAWLAGFVDGEGTISITRLSPTPKNRTYNTKYRAFFSVTSTNEAVMKYVKNSLDYLYGKDFGFLTANEPKKVQHKASYTFVVTKLSDLLMIVSILQPYLVLKKRQAQIAIDFIESRMAKLQTHWQRKGYTFSELEIAFCNELQALNKRGV